jgi:hypothetical protein
MSAADVDPRRAAAELKVEQAYDRGRAKGYLDLGRGRRERRLRRLEAELDDATRRVELEPPTRDELVAAFRADARRRMRPRGAEESIRNALRRAALELEQTFDLEGTFDAILFELGVAAELERIRNRSRSGRTVEA